MPASPTVVHLKRKDGKVVVDCDLYIGRAMYQGGWKLSASKWANPYKVVDGSPEARTRALQLYEAHVRSLPALMGSLRELDGKRLGCWCAPLPCHGDVLVKLWRESQPQRSAEEKGAALPAPDDPVWAELEHLFE